MKGLRSAYVVVALVLSALPGCEAPERSARAGDSSLSDGRAYADELSARAWSATVEARDVIALGYLERLRLGMGSPFRLVDYALRDPRLEPETARLLAWSLLARTAEGEAYRVDPEALSLSVGVDPAAARGAQHLELIEGAVAEARDPRGGELAVRLAYALAEAEGGVRAGAPKLAAQAAALLRDRELARRDAVALLRAAASGGEDALDLLQRWRAERRFAVEAPALSPLPAEAEREAVQLAPRLSAAVRMLPHRSPAAATAASPVPLLSGVAAAELSRLAEALASPAQAPVAVALELQREDLLGQPWLSPARRRARERLLELAATEERFAAEHALAVRSGGGSALARTALATAVSLRPYAQEEPWFPGSGGPSTRELVERFGLRSVSFDEAVPAGWRPYYRRMVAQALADLQRVLPSLDLRGLALHFGQGRGRQSTLALHDPRSRTIHLPPSSGAGTIAHEIAHDLDWQVALERYRVRGDYGSDRATRLRGDRLASSVRGLSDATLVPPSVGDPAIGEHARRPAEIFARNVDWFVVASLARAGRTNGYLSSVQDELLTGYGTAGAPPVGGGAGSALVSILDDVAPVYADTRTWYLRRYGPSRALSAYELVRRVLDGRPAARRPLSTGLDDLAAVDADEAAALTAIDAWTCRAPGAAYDAELHEQRRRLVHLAAEARARGVALERADDVAGEEGRRWLARRFQGAPWPAAELDEDAVELLEALAARVVHRGAAEPPAGSGPFELEPVPVGCGAAEPGI